ncbi:MAG: hypothetical protein LR015_08060 [Verrucomicrobia bacterium]|nr:hypothetical protein [Verrucomicrobiota bacterium]
MDALLPIFFRNLVLADRTVLLTRPTLDIPLREGLRIIADWVAWEQAGGRPKDALAQLKPSAATAP